VVTVADADRLTPLPDLSPTERAIATMRARRDTAVCPLVGDEWLLLAEVERLRAELERATRPSYSDWHVWMVWQEERPIHAVYATEDDAKQGSIDCWEEDEPSCPDYSWKVHANDRLELLVGGELAEVYITRMDVFGKAMVAAREAGADLRQALHVAVHDWEMGNLAAVHGMCLIRDALGTEAAS